MKTNHLIVALATAALLLTGCFTSHKGTKGSNTVLATEDPFKETDEVTINFKKMKGSGADMEALERAIQLLAVGDAMPPSYDDRPYMDENNANRSCHVGSGWRLYYSKSDGNLELRSVRHVGNLI